MSASTTPELPETLTVDELPERLRVMYLRDLKIWADMVAFRGFAMTWRDEQSFLRGWVSGRGLVQ
jgi:hypothetical protein